MEKKLKVVLLCHYWSDEMAEMVGRKHYFRELSPWIQEKLNLFKKHDDIELHVVAPNYASNSDVEAIRDNIHYHYYHYSPGWLSRLTAPFIKLLVNHAETYKIAERLANTLTGFRTPARQAAGIVRRIAPDLIHLYGSENPDYASAAIQLMNDYPLLLTVQGYVCMQQSSRKPLERMFFNYRLKYERKINCSVKYVTTSKNISLEEHKANEAPYLCNCERLYHVTAITKVPNLDAFNSEKNYDVVYYARIDKNKGIEDLIDTIALLRERGRSLKTLIMGRGGEAYVAQLKKAIEEKGVSDIIDFAGFIESHDEVYRLAAQARVLVLPTHNDGIPNTIREAMFMHLPVVANNVGGIPRFNENRHCVHLTECENNESLASGILRVLDDSEYQNMLIDNGYKEANEIYSPAVIYGQMIEAYRDVYKCENN